MLDVPFGENASRSRTNHSAENLALIRRAAMNLLRQGMGRQSLRQRKLRAAVSDTYRERLLFGGRHSAIGLGQQPSTSAPG